MGILGSAFGRALAGAGGAAKQISSRYIDEELAQQRAQAIADIQRNNASAMRGDQLKFDTDPTNVAARAGAARTTALAAGDTAREVKRAELGDTALADLSRQRAAGDISAAEAARRQAETETLNDPTYQGARRSNADADADAEIQRKLKAGEALLPQEVKRARQLAEAQYGTAAKYREPRAGAGGSDDALAKLPPAVKAAYAATQKQADRIDAAIVKAQADGMWDPQNNKAQSDLMVQQRVLGDKAMSMLAPYLPQSQAGAQDAAIRDLLLGGAKPEAAKPQAKPGAAPAAKPADEGPTIWQRAKDAVSGVVSVVRSEGAAINAIRQRVAEASQGGPPLTAEERQEARKFGIWVPE